MIADRHFIDASAPASQLDRDLRFKAESVGAEGRLGQQRRAERLVARAHVGEVHVRHQVAHPRDPPVRHGVPVVHHAPLAGDHEPRPVHRVRLALQKRLQQVRVFAGIVFQIGILNQAVLAVCVLHRGADGRALPQVALVPDQKHHAGVSLRDLFHDLVGAIRRSVVHHDDFPPQPFRQWGREDSFEECPHEFLFVEKRDQYRDGVAWHQYGRNG